MNDFAQLMNAHAGKTAVVIGKGKSLDTWIARGCPQPHDSIRIGINQTAWRVLNVPYSVSGDVQMEHYAPHAAEVGTTFIRGVPYQDLQGRWINELQPDTGIWFDACTADRHDRLYQSRFDLAESRKLYCHQSSANPAIHLAWYLGCVSLMLVGIDGGTGRAQAMTGLADRDPPPTYDKMKVSVDAQSDVLYGKRWRRWSG